MNKNDIIEIAAMSYDKIDKTINVWASQRKLNIFTLYQDYDVRSTEVVDELGNKYQIWIDEPNSDGSVEVHAWDYKKRRKDFITTALDLMSALEAAHQQVSSWIDDT